MVHTFRIQHILYTIRVHNCDYNNNYNLGLLNAYLNKIFLYIVNSKLAFFKDFLLDIFSYYLKFFSIINFYPLDSNKNTRHCNYNVKHNHLVVHYFINANYQNSCQQIQLYANVLCRNKFIFNKQVFLLLPKNNKFPLSCIALFIHLLLTHK